MLDFLIYFLCHDFLLINFEISSVLHTSYKNGPFKKLSFDNAKNCIDNNKPFENVVCVNVTRNRLHLYFVHAYINMFVYTIFSKCLFGKRIMMMDNVNYLASWCKFQFNHKLLTEHRFPKK